MGATVAITVTNGGGDTLVWNPCVRILERREGAPWIAADEGDRMCTMEGWILRPGERVEAATELAPKVGVGS